MTKPDLPSRQRSLVGDLFDLRFRYLITPRLVGCLYAVSIMFIGSVTLFGVLFIWGISTWAGAGWWWFAPIIVSGGLMALIVTRVILEWVLVVFYRYGGPR